MIVSISRFSSRRRLSNSKCAASWYCFQPSFWSTVSGNCLLFFPVFVPSSMFPLNVTTQKADIFQPGIIQDIVSSYPPIHWVICYPEFQALARETTLFIKTNMPVCLICSRWKLVKLIIYCCSLWICWLGCDFPSDIVLLLYRWMFYW